MLPPWPGWDGLHPLVIHFPIALLMIAPLFLFLAMVGRQHAQGFAWSALVLLVLGTTAAFVAVSTGQAAAELAERSEAINAVLLRHEELAEQTSRVFAGITALYVVLLLLPVFVKRLVKSQYRTIVSGVMLLVVLAGSLLLVMTAHQGGTLVHRFGVHTMLPPSS
jgi:uncharacterized membrane protein